MINQSYLNTVKDVCEQIIDFKKNKKNIFFLISGPQGSGKSTFSFHVKKSLEKKKLKVLVLSIDNFYLSKNDRLNLSKKIPNLFETRGVPGTHNFKFLKEVLKKFRLNKKIILSNNALGENTAIKKLFLSNLTYNSSISEFNKNSKYLKFKNLILNENVNQNFSKVKQITFDQYFKSKKIKNSFLKIDVEGYEYNVLRGASYKIKDVKYILIENQFSNQYQNDFNKIKKLLNKNNFKLIKNFYYPSLHYKDMLFKNEKYK